MQRPALLVFVIVLAAPGLARAQDEGTSPHGAAWRAQAQKVTEAGMSQLTDCQKQALKAHRDLKGGEVQVHWLVDDQGNVSSVEVLGAKDPGLKHCLEQAVSGWTFPPWTVAPNQAPYVPLSQTVTLKVKHPKKKPADAKPAAGAKPGADAKPAAGAATGAGDAAGAGGD